MTSPIISSKEFSPIEIKSGIIIDGFTVGECVFTGGAARLYEVTHPDHQIPLLMKVPRLGPDQPTAGLIGFEVERMIMPRIHGSHVPRCIAVGDMNTAPYIVMERIDGENIGAMVDPEKSPTGLPIDQVVSIGAALAQACHALHKQDVLHLDIKPDNLFIKSNGEVVLIDFGFSHHAHFPDLFQEEGRKMVGSAPYIAPEQVLGVRSNSKSDQFAIGACLYELLTGKLPFGIPETETEVKSRLWQEISPPRALRPDCPPWLQEVILTCLEVNPSDRFKSSILISHGLKNPATIELTERANRTHAPGFMRQIKATLNYRKHAAKIAEELSVVPSAQINDAPLILVAVDVNHPDKALLDAVGEAAARALKRHEQSRLTCLTIVTQKVGEESRDSSESSRHQEYFIALQRWLKKAELPEEACTLHVFETSDPAERIIRYATDNDVDVIIMGGTRKLHHRLGLGRCNMTKVVEEAPCSVHIIRTAD